MDDWIAACTCGAFRLRAAGDPIVSTACYCSDCQAAGHDLEALSGAPKLVDDDGGTPMVLFRKDRVAAVDTEALLREYRLNADTPTRRLVAACCNTPMAVDFTKGFWLAIYADRLGDKAPPLEMRTMVKQRPTGVVLSSDVSNCEGHSGKFMLRLLSTWVGMGFRRPALPSYPSITPGR
jgi:hypothetical protein